MGFEPMRSIRSADLKSAPLDQLGQSGALGAGIEPATPRLTVGCSNQLSYGTLVVSDIIVYNYSARVMHINVQGEESNSARVF